jgi:hypothetical protein
MLYAKRAPHWARYYKEIHMPAKKKAAKKKAKKR